MNYFIIPGVNKYQLNADSIFKAIEKITGILNNNVLLINVFIFILVHVQIIILHLD